MPGREAERESGGCQGEREGERESEDASRSLAGCTYVKQQGLSSVRAWVSLSSLSCINHPQQGHSGHSPRREPHTHTHTHTLPCTHCYTPTNTCVHSYLHTSTHTHSELYTHKHTHTCKCTHTHIHSHPPSPSTHTHKRYPMPTGCPRPPTICDEVPTHSGLYSHGGP